MTHDIRNLKEQWRDETAHFGCRGMTAGQLDPERSARSIEVWRRCAQRIEIQIGWLEEARDRLLGPSGTESSAA
jgi:hypothetical protein